MAEIRAFRGLRFSEAAGSLEGLVAPPYDVLSKQERDEYGEKSPHNIVHLTLPEAHPDDRSKYVKYARSAARLAEWRREGALTPEAAPSLYRYTQSFTVPGMGEAFSRTAVIALIKVEPYENGVVLPHEQTFPKHKEDRMRILEATRAHLECIFGLYEDPDGAVLREVQEARPGERVEVDAENVHHALEPISDPEAVGRIAALMADKKVWIADGHHRYETAVAFRQNLGPRDGPIAEDFMMMALSSMSDPGLVLLPTHRILSELPLGLEESIAALERDFDLRETHSSRLMLEIEENARHGRRAFGVVLAGPRAFVATPKDDAALLGAMGDEGSEALRALDVSVLHRGILERTLAVRGLDSIAYTRSWQEAVRAVEQGSAGCFLMNPPSVEDMKQIALGGEKMPQKSTYYFPKILSGLVLWSLNDF
jgi:uncharacterized protein (DUF1015 family)